MKQKEPCPWCANTSITLCRDEDGMVHAQCDMCGAMGPQVAVIGEHYVRLALDLWDARDDEQLIMAAYERKEEHDG